MRSKQYASMFTWLYIFSSELSLCFFPETEIKCTPKMIVKSIFKCRKTINSPKNCYWEKTTLQRMISRHSPHSSPRWQQQQQHSPLFPIGKQIQTFPFKFPYKTHGKRFIVYCWVIDALRRLRIAKLTTTSGITNSLLTSSACSIGIWSTLALLNLIRRIF